MSGWLARVLLASLGLLFLAAVASYFLTPVKSEAELRERVAAAPVTWQNYSEDIKAIDARAAAEWRGELREVRLEDNSYVLVFALQGPWTQRNFGMPVLARDSLGYARRAEFTGNQEDAVTYRVSFPESGDLPSRPWLDVQYPHGERRVPLDKEGNWRAE